MCSEQDALHPVLLWCNSLNLIAECSNRDLGHCPVFISFENISVLRCCLTACDSELEFGKGQLSQGPDEAFWMLLPGQVVPTAVGPAWGSGGYCRTNPIKSTCAESLF